MTFGRIATGVWLTAYCAHVLIRFGQAEWAGLGAVPQSGGGDESSSADRGRPRCGAGKMRVLVTGGAGYVGSHLVRGVRRAGHVVRALDLAPASGDCIQGNVADANVVAQAVRDVQVVYHLAWGLYPGNERREIQENLLGTLNLLQAARAANVRHFVFASSAVVYGPTGPARVDEEHPCYPERSTIGGLVYGITKLTCEKLCLMYQRRGLPVTIFRMHGVFSERHLSQFGQMIEQALAGEAVKAIREAGGEYAHLEDVLRAFLGALDRPEADGEILNLAGSHTYRDPELARYIVGAVDSRSVVELTEDPTQGMISVSVDKLCRLLGLEPEHDEFLTSLIQNALSEPGRTPRTPPGSPALFAH